MTNNPFLTGDTHKFATEWYVNKVLPNRSMVGIGYFCFYVDRRTFGVRDNDATLLACSLDNMENKLRNNGKHVSPLAEIEDPSIIVSIYLNLLYSGAVLKDVPSQIKLEEIKNDLTNEGVILAPDGDSAFDDGAHILQFDKGNYVRLVAFLNVGGTREIFESIVDISISASLFYGTLRQSADELERYWKLHS